MKEKIKLPCLKVVHPMCSSYSINRPIFEFHDLIDERAESQHLQWKSWVAMENAKKNTIFVDL